MKKVYSSPVSDLIALSYESSLLTVSGTIAKSPWDDGMLASLDSFPTFVF